MSRWTDEEWLAGFRGWIVAAVRAAGHAVTGEIEQPYFRPWSTVLRVPTGDGPLWAKACLPVLGHEAALVESLTSWWPDGMPGLVAVDTDRGWILSRDAGEPLRGSIATAGDLDRWRPLLTRYAELQQLVAPRVDELLAYGVPDFRPATLPERYKAALADAEAVRLGRPEGLTTDQHHALLSLAPRLEDLCAALDASGVPDSLDNDDLHDANVYVRDGRLVVTDWGDACVTHPFVSLVVLSRSAARRLSLPPGSPELAALRDHYLAGFGADLAALRETAVAAYGVGLVVRGLAWDHLVRGMDEADRPPYVDALPGYLQDFLAWCEAPEP